MTISSSKNKDDLESFELNNGQLLFRASHQFSAALFYLGTLKEPAHNYLKTFYPEVRPFLYHERFYGGILPIVLSISKWRSREFHQLQFTTRKIKKQQWAGVVFESEIIKYDESLKGLKAIISYLTLPESPLLLVDLEVKNESKTKRKFKSRIIANLNTSGTPNDMFYCEGVDGRPQVMQYSDHDASIGPSVNQHVAIHVPSHAPYSLGMALWSSRPRARVEVLNMNLSLAFFFSEQPLVNIATDESHHLRALFILAKDHQAIFPFGTVDLSKLSYTCMKILDDSKDRS